MSADITPPSGPAVTMTATNDVADLGRVQDTLAGFWADQALPDESAMDVSLVLEEVFLNIVHHAFDDRRRHDIPVRIALDAGAIVLTVEDDGAPFNPLEAPEANVTLPLDERPIGGLGIMLIRGLMDEVVYTRDGARNRLVLTKRVLPWP